jgi:hypothetical protein
LSRHLVWRVLAVLAVVGGAVAVVSTRQIRLGLDLEGGTGRTERRLSSPSSTTLRSLLVSSRGCKKTSTARLRDTLLQQDVLRPPGVRMPSQAGPRLLREVAIEAVPRGLGCVRVYCQRLL